MGNLAVANTLILDEPTNRLDLESASECIPRGLPRASEQKRAGLFVKVINRVMGFEEYLEAG